MRRCKLLAELAVSRTVITGLSRMSIIGAVVVCSIACAASVQAQSDNPIRLQEIMDQKNAEAAHDTWGDRQIQPAFPAPSSNSPSSQPSGSSSVGSTSSTPSTGPTSFASFSPGGSDAGSSSAPSQQGASENLSANSYGPATQADAEILGAPLPSLATATPSPGSFESIATIKPATPARRATASYTDGLLTIHADNSSLNQILRQVSHLTGTVITGGVAEERVFGNYGPAKPSTVLSALLRGTGSNFLMSGGSNGSVMKLVLTPRGGPTEPGPGDPQFDSDGDHSLRSQGVQPLTGDIPVLPRTPTKSFPVPNLSIPSFPNVPQH